MTPTPEPRRCACPCGCGQVIRLLTGEQPDPDGLCWPCRRAILVGARPHPHKEPACKG